MFAGAFYLGTQHALYACQHPTQARIVRGIIHHTLFAGKSDIALQHTAVEPGGFILEDTFLLVEEGSQHRGIGTHQSYCSIMVMLAAQHSAVLADLSLWVISMPCKNIAFDIWPCRDQHLHSSLVAKHWSSKEPCCCRKLLRPRRTCNMLLLSLQHIGMCQSCSLMATL